jgi:hypothetical protein
VFLLTDEQIDRIISYRRIVMIGSMGWVAVMWLLPRGWSVGVVTAFMLIFAGAICGCLEEWRSQAGLWMLATFCGILSGIGYAFFEYMLFEASFNAPPAVQAAPAGWGGIHFVCDFGIGLIVLGKVARFAISVAVRNWQLTHETRSFDE